MSARESLGVHQTKKPGRCLRQLSGFYFLKAYVSKLPTPLKNKTRFLTETGFFGLGE